MPPVAIGANVVTGIGTSSPNRACAGESLRGPQLRIRERPGVGVVLQQPVVDAGKPGEQHVGCGQVAKVLRA